MLEESLALGRAAQHAVKARGYVTLERTQSMSFSQDIALVKWKYRLLSPIDYKIFTNLFHDSGGKLSKLSFFTFDASSDSSAAPIWRQ